MPTFPSSPLKSRTVSFPQSGFKAGLSDDAFPLRISSGLPSSFVHLATAQCPRAVSRTAAHQYTTVQAISAALPQGSSLQAGYAVPPFNAYRPHAPRSPAHSDFASPANTECHRCVPNRNTSATSEWFRAFTVRSFSTCRPLRPRGVH